MEDWDTGDRQDREGEEQGPMGEPEGPTLPEQPAEAQQDDAAVREDAFDEGFGASEEAPESQRWPSSRLPWEVADSVASSALGGREAAAAPVPASLPETPDEPLPPPRRSRVVPVLIALVVVIAGLAGGVAYYLHTEAAQRRDALLAAVQAVSLTASPEFADTIQQRLAPIKQAIGEGKYAEATNRLKHIMKDVAPAEAEAGPRGGLDGGMLGQPPVASRGPKGPENKGGGPAAGGVPKGAGAPPEAAELPPAAMAFFEANPELAQTVAQANMAGLKLKEMGGNVDKLRRIRGAIIEAARLQDKDKVIALLGDFQKELQAQAGKLGPRPGRMPGGPSMRPGAGQRGGRRMPPRQLMALVRQVNSEMQKAQAEGKDLRKAAGLMQQAERAGAAGGFGKATELARQALKAIRSAPKLPPEPELFSSPLVGMFLNLLHVEDNDLAATLAALRKTLKEADDAAVAGLRNALKGAADTLAKVGARRQAFSKRLQEIRGGKEPSPQEQQQAAAQMRKRVDEARAELVKILAQSRDLSPEQFAQKRDKIVDSILETVFGPPGPSSAAPGRPQPVPTTEERVRSKLLSASDPYLQVLADPEEKDLAARTRELFRQARARLASRQYEQAEDLVDEGLRLLGVPVGPRPTEATEAPDDAVPRQPADSGPVEGEAQPPPGATPAAPQTAPEATGEDAPPTEP